MEYKTHGTNNNQYKSKPNPPIKILDGFFEIFRDLFWGPKKKILYPTCFKGVCVDLFGCTFFPLPSHLAPKINPQIATMGSLTSWQNMAVHDCSYLRWRSHVYPVITAALGQFVWTPDWTFWAPRRTGFPEGPTKWPLKKWDPIFFS